MSRVARLNGQHETFASTGMKTASPRLVYTSRRRGGWGSSRARRPALGDYSKNVSSCEYGGAHMQSKRAPSAPATSSCQAPGRDQHRVAGDDLARLAVDLEHAAAGGEEVDLLRPRVVVALRPLTRLQRGLSEGLRGVWWSSRIVEPSFVTKASTSAAS